MKRTSRRDFLKLGGSVAGAGWLAGHWPAMVALGTAACDARDRGAALVNIEPSLAADLAAVAAQIFPGDDTDPGANEIGVIHFIDAALGSFMAGAAGLLSQGVGELNAAAGTETRFAGLGAERQRELLQQHQQTPWFGAVRFLTIGGMFAMPGYGGNRDRLGWAMLGFDHRHSWSAPFGYYDRHANDDD